ncbi:hypothetical protein OGM63_03455 [Plectonema radiosum NIES-515]|uniref:Uncharacterized protein n=1 Tax=Plectonema radiosum NIES-515 TaxID=2986073 RepID=A0ABT3ATZ7_9CYAN|nr:hypothetical protein [Plectonema radiosum]MCV3212596.1 hypothetical protein [Plectonema radiosum NIES-515]
MKNKVLAILAASAAALGSAIFAAPAHAVEQNVDVNVTIQPTIYLRTFKTINLQISQGDLGAIDKDYDPSNTTDGSAILSRIAPANLARGTQTEVTKNVKELFAVWSNSGKAVTVTVKPVPNDTTTGGTVLTNPVATTRRVTLKTATATGGFNGTPDEELNPLVGGADLVFDVSRAVAGSYSGGQIKVEALATP